MRDGTSGLRNGDKKVGSEWAESKNLLERKEIARNNSRYKQCNRRTVLSMVSIFHFTFQLHVLFPVKFKEIVTPNNDFGHFV